MAAEGFAGAFYSPRGTAARRPAVLAFGGSEGGAGSGRVLARALAALGIGYFKATGLPGALDRIPLEYFATAIRWLATRPGGDPSADAIAGRLGARPHLELREPGLDAWPKLLALLAAGTAGR